MFDNQFLDNHYILNVYTTYERTNRTGQMLQILQRCYDSFVATKSQVQMMTLLRLSVCPFWKGYHFKEFSDRSYYVVVPEASV